MKDLYIFRDWYRNNAALIYTANLTRSLVRFDPEIETKVIVNAEYIFEQIFGPNSFPSRGYHFSPATNGNSREGVLGDFAGTIIGNDTYGFQKGFSWIEDIIPGSGPPEGSLGGGVGKTSLGDVIMSWAGKIIAGAGIVVLGTASATVSAPVAIIAGAGYIVATYSAAKTTAEYLDENKNESDKDGNNKQDSFDEGGKDFIHEVNMWAQKKRLDELYELIKSGVALNFDELDDNPRERRFRSMMMIQKLNLSTALGENWKYSDSDDASGSEYRYRVNLYGDGSVYHDYKMWVLWNRGAPIDPMPVMSITRYEA